MPNAGQKIRALDFPPTVSDTQNANITGFSDTTFAAGSTTCGVAFVAPTSGRVTIDWGGAFESNGTTDIVSVSFHVRTGDVVGSGSDVLAANDENVVQSSAGTNLASRHGAGRKFLLTGLTPGADYNVVTMHKMSGATNTGDIFNRYVVVEPAT